MFKKKQTPQHVQTEPAQYPTGTCVKTEDGHFFIQGKFRHRIVSERILESWRFPHIAHATEAALAGYPVFKKLGFRNGTVIYDISEAKYYVIVDGAKCQVADPDVFERLGTTRSEAIWASDEEVKLHKDGEVLR